MHAVAIYGLIIGQMIKRAARDGWKSAGLAIRFLVMLAAEKCALFLLCCIIVIIAVSGDTDSLIDIYPPVAVSASSVLEQNGTRFLPEWAIDRVSSPLWFNCFVSQREINPWWKLDMQEEKRIANVNIFFKKDDDVGLPDVKLNQTFGLAVYVDSNAMTTSGAHSPCGSTISPESEDRLLQLNCSNLVGRYVHVIVTSLQPSYLSLCDVFLNFVENGGSLLYAEIEDVRLFRSNEDFQNPLNRIIDDDPYSCGATNESSQANVVRIHLPTTILVSQFRAYLETVAYNRNYQVFAGSHRTVDVEDNDEVLNQFSVNRTAVALFTSPVKPLFANTFVLRILTIDPEANISMCELEIFQQNSILLDIYSSSTATALNELEASSLASKAIDKSRRTEEHACYRSFKQGGSWWRLAFNESKKISYIVITPLPEASALREMDGFAVYVGNKTTSVRRDNVPCRLPPMVHPLSSGIALAEIQVACFGQPVGKYVYVVASDRSTLPTPSLSLCEVQTYDCEGSDSAITTTSGDLAINPGEQATLSCSARGCPTPSIEWRKRRAILNASSHLQDGLNVTSAITLQGNGIEDTYTCIAYNGRAANSSSVVKLSIYPFLVETPQNVSLTTPRQVVKQNCSAKGYPLPSITWTSSTGHGFTVISNHVASLLTSSTIAVISSGDARFATFRCTASNGLGRDATAEAHISEIRVAVRNAYGRVGDTLNLVCNARGSADLFIEWYKGSLKIVSTAFTSTADSAESVLTFPNAQLSNGSSSYLCKTGRTGYPFTIIATEAKVGIFGNFTSMIDRNFRPGESKPDDPFTCSFTAAPRPIVAELQLDGKTVANLTQENSSTNQWTIVYPITSVTVLEGGKYTCLVRMDLSVNVTATALLRIDVAFTLFSMTQEGLRSQTPKTTIWCRATSFPRPIMGFSRSFGQYFLEDIPGNVEYNEPRREMTIIYTFVGNDISKVGHYSCWARNNDFPGADTKRHSPLLVTVKPLLTTERPTVPAKRGQSIELGCRSSSYPPSPVTWTFRSIPLLSAQNSVVDNVTTISALNLTSVNAVKDGGVYRCSATNSLGKSSIDVTLKFNPQVMTDPAGQEVPYGGRLFLTCQVTSFPASITIHWYRDNQSLSESLAETNVTDGENGTTVNSTITIRSVDEHDGGNYTCQTGGVSSSPAVIAIGNQFVLNPQNQTVYEGAPVSLSCQISGYPPPAYVIWQKSSDNGVSYVDLRLKNGTSSVNTVKLLRSMASRLNITEMRRLDAGQYRCQYGSVFSQSAQIIFRFNPNVTMNPASQEISYGSTLSLSCEISNPASPIRWYRDSNQSLSLSMIDTNITNEGNGTVANSRLTIPNANEEDGGNYTCRTDRISSRLAIITIGRGVVLDPQNETALEETSITLSCQIAGYPPPSWNITWQKSVDRGISYVGVRSNGSLLIKFVKMPRSTLGLLNIKSLRRFDAGLYRCRYEELFSLPAQINVHYIPFLIRANFSGDDVMDFGSSFTLLCIAEGNPIPTVVFYRTTRILPSVTEILHGGNVHYTDGVTATSKTKETILTIHNTSTSDSGDYFCRASNRHSHVNSSLFHVFIQGPPSSIDPADIVVVRKTNSSIAINWTEPYDGGRTILEYTVSYKEEESVNEYQVADTVNGSEFATTISDLMELTMYSILVVAKNDKGQARGTEPAKVRTEAGVPPSPRDFRAAVWNSTSAFVEWKPAPSQKNKFISYYRVYYVAVRKGPSPLLYAIVGRDKTSDVISGLRSFIEYALHVRAVNEWEDGTHLLAPPTNTMSITTLEDAPFEPQNVIGETIVSSTSTLRVVWKQPIHPNGLIRKYTIYYRKKIPESSQKLNVTVDGDQTAVIIGNLALYTTYVIQIQAHTIEPGLLSQPVEGVTGQGPPSAPRQLTVLNNGRRSVSLQWTAPAIPRGVVIQYTIFYRGRKWYSGYGRKRESFSVRSSRVVKSPPLTTYTVDDLTPNTLWTFYVAASSEGGIGDASKTVSERTLEAEPSPVVAAPPDPCTFTETTATLPLVAPSEGNGRTGRIDLLVAAVESNSSSLDVVDFTTFAPASNVSANVSALNASQIYVAATFESRDALPAEFILGRGETVDGYTNAPLRPGTTYRYGLRVYSATNDSLFTTSNPQTLTTLKDIETDGCPRCLYTIVSAASCAGGALLGMISIVVLLCCVKKARAVRGYYK